MFEVKSEKLVFCWRALDRRMLMFWLLGAIKNDFCSNLPPPQFRPFFRDRAQTPHCQFFNEIRLSAKCFKNCSTSKPHSHELKTIFNSLRSLLRSEAKLMFVKRFKKLVAGLFSVESCFRFDHLQRQVLFCLGIWSKLLSEKYAT